MNFHTPRWGDIDVCDAAPITQGNEVLPTVQIILARHATTRHSLPSPPGKGAHRERVHGHKHRKDEGDDSVEVELAAPTDQTATAAVVV